jgi:signal transduction histidine kinase
LVKDRTVAGAALRQNRRMDARPPVRPLRVLHLEDSDLDHELALAQLRRAGLAVQARRIESRAEFERELDGDWDLVLSDFNLPGFSGLQALELLRASGRELPFILVSGEIGEDTAVEAMRNGASDYLLKNNLARLAPAMEHAIEAADARRARHSATAELQVSRERLAELARHLQTSVEQERSAIAREIHDDVGGSLTALKFDLAWIARHADADAVRARAQSALDTVTHAIESSQRIMHNLRPAILEQGLVAALQWMASRFERRTGIACELHAGDGRLVLPEGVPLVAYRVAQEALTNVSKHAQATRVRLDLLCTPDMLSLEVADDGRGFGARERAKAGSFGLRGLAERAATVGGWIDISSSTRGTTLLLSVPLDGADAAGKPAAAADDGHHDPSGWGDL